MKLFQPDGKLVLIAGPCVVESRETVLRIAERLKEIAAARPITLVFKASFDKANRTSVDSFRGPGLEAGLEVLAAVVQVLVARVLGLVVLVVWALAALVPRARGPEALELQAPASRALSQMGAESGAGSSRWVSKSSKVVNQRRCRMGRER